MAAARGRGLGAGLPGAEPKLLPPEQAFRLSARALDPATIEARFDVADGYYLYRDKLPSPSSPSGGRAGGACRAASASTTSSSATSRPIAAAVVIRVAAGPSAAPGATLTLHADSQGCADAGVCYPPNPQQLTAHVPAAGAKPGTHCRGAPKKGWFK